MKLFYISLFFLVFSKNLFAQKISVSLFNELSLQTVLVTPVNGSYSIITDSGVFHINPNQIIYVSRAADSVKVRDMVSHLGTWKRISIVARADDGVIRISPIVPSMPARIYDNNLGFYVDFNRMMAINIVDMDNYIAGVVEAESGPSANIEFYKAQALLARTYALGHMERHAGEGFNLCDEVHCQVYKGKSTKNPSIIKATVETKGQVVVNSKNELILGAFHANCGGQTANAGDVWLAHREYLTSIIDSHCRGQSSSQWEVRIPIEDWRNFLKTRGVNTDDLPPASFIFASKERVYYYEVEGVKIPMTDIRNHFKLRSAFFNVDISSNTVRLRGRGYGHGVGMCQDGAMQMARRGRNYREILYHYFQGIRIVNYVEANGFNEDIFFDDELGSN